MSKTVLDPTIRLTYHSTMSSTSRQISASYFLRLRTVKYAAKSEKEEILANMSALGRILRDLNRAALNPMKKIRNKVSVSGAGFHQRIKNLTR